MQNNWKNCFLYHDLQHLESRWDDNSSPTEMITSIYRVYSCLNLILHLIFLVLFADNFEKFLND
jgi:hypothetical protein